MLSPEVAAQSIRDLADRISKDAEWVSIFEDTSDPLLTNYNIVSHWKPVQPTPELVFTTSQCVMRKTPAFTGAILRYLPRWEIVPVLEVVNTWLKVSYTHPYLGTTIGYIEEDKTELFVPCDESITIDNAFDPTIQRIYIPAAPSIPDKPEQYISLDAIAGMGKSVHYNLCGPFCAAALAGADIIPALQLWLETTDHPIYHELIYNDQPMGLNPIASILHTYTKDTSTVTFSPNVNPFTARVLSTWLENGKFIAGVGIDRAGTILANGAIRHWIVLLDVVICGTGGFVRVYNPFHNREETVDFHTLWQSMFPGGASATMLLVKE
jgi:hypothetical protein